MKTKVAIIGAGLGGLACAIALRKQGFEVQVYEQAKDFRPVGGGLALFPNGLNFLELIEPDIVEEIKNSGCCLQKIVIKNIAGETISSSLTQDLTNWAEPIRNIIKNTPSDNIFEVPICDRSPLNSWSQGRVTLLGDAAHPMSPSMGQGANTAFEDAWVLTQCLVRFSNIEEAFNEYEKERMERTKIMQIKSAEGEKNQWRTTKKTQPQPPKTRKLDSSFTDWLYQYQPFLKISNV